MSELKPCPFCGNQAGRGMGIKAGTNSVYCQCGALKLAHGWNRRPLEDALQAEIERLREAQRWIQVGERLPEFELGMASKYVDIAYRIPGSRSYMRETVQYWEKYGWVFKWENGKAETLDDYGYVVEFWKPLFPLPEPPQEAEG